MKKLGFFLLLILGMMIAGCGGGGAKVKGNVFGYIKDQNNSGVDGVLVKVGGRTGTTDPTGRYEITGVVVGTYQVTASGGTSSSGHYLSAPVSKTVIEGDNDFETIIAYKLLGCGIIIENTSGEMGSLAVRQSVKNAISNETVFFKSQITPVKSSSKSIGSYALATNDTLLNNISYFYLNWEPLIVDSLDADHYEIYYLGPNGTLNEKVWDSRPGVDPHPEDPAYDTGAPAAYLDITYELADKVTTAGAYQFRVIGYNAGGTVSKEFPVITASIGKLLSNFPTGLQYTAPAHLSWTGLTGASGYRVGVFSDQALEISVWNSGVTLLPPTTTSVNVTSGLIGGNEYYWSVIAYALDETGWTAESTRGISGFYYEGI